MVKTRDLIDEVLSLPVEERALLVDTILGSMNPSSRENDQKWAKTAKRRLEELNSGKVQTIPGEEVFNRVWSSFSK